MTKGEWIHRLQSAPTVEYDGPVCRCVVKAAFDGGKPPSYLFTSGRRNRCNPSGTRCLYISADRDTALSEYDSYFEREPHLVYYGHFKAARIVDLGDAATLAHFDIDLGELFAKFKLSVRPTLLQQLGYVVSRQTEICAIRFPSNACRKVGRSGWNLAVFPDALRAPDSLIIHGPGDSVLEQWP